MKNKVPKTSKDVLLTLLRKKQAEEGLRYITTKSTSYRIIRWLFFAAVVYCTLINLFYIIGKSGEMAANLANMGAPQPHQELEIARLYTTLNIMVVATIGIVLSEIFVWLKMPVLQIVFSVASSITIIARLYSEIKDPTGSTLAANHIIPLVILCVFGAISSTLHIHQLYRDKQGCNEISAIIYQKYGMIAKDISPDEWNNILLEYKPEKPVSKKRSVKISKKQSESQKDTIETNS